jgi:hypothetical protein
MERLSDDKLILIVTKERNNYQEEALKAAERVLNQRNVSFEIKQDEVEIEEKEEVYAFKNIEEAGAETNGIQFIPIGEDYLEAIRNQKRKLIIIASVTVPVIIAMSIVRIGFAGLSLPVLFYLLKLIIVIRATHQKNNELQEMRRAKEEIDLQNEIISGELEEKAKKAFLAIGNAIEYGEKKKDLVHFFENEITSKEDLLELERAFKVLFYKNLQHELMNTSTAYSTIKTMLYPYIKFGLVEAEYPHKRTA